MVLLRVLRQGRPAQGDILPSGDRRREAVLEGGVVDGPVLRGGRRFELGTEFGFGEDELHVAFAPGPASSKRNHLLDEGVILERRVGLRRLPLGHHGGRLLLCCRYRRSLVLPLSGRAAMDGKGWDGATVAK